MLRTKSFDLKPGDLQKLALQHEALSKCWIFWSGRKLPQRSRVVKRNKVFVAMNTKWKEKLFSYHLGNRPWKEYWYLYPKTPWENSLGFEIQSKVIFVGRFRLFSKAFISKCPKNCVQKDPNYPLISKSFSDNFLTIISQQNKRKISSSALTKANQDRNASCKSWYR